MKEFNNDCYKLGGEGLNNWKPLKKLLCGGPKHPCQYQTSNPRAYLNSWGRYLLRTILSKLELIWHEKWKFLLKDSRQQIRCYCSWTSAYNIALFSLMCCGRQLRSTVKTFLQKKKITAKSNNPFLFYLMKKYFFLLQPDFTASNCWFQSLKRQILWWKWLWKLYKKRIEPLITLSP